VGSQSCTVTETLTVVETMTGNTVTAIAARADKKAKPTKKKTKKTVVVGSKSVTITGGQSETLKVTLNGTGTALLRKHGKLPVAVTVKQGSRTLRSQHVTLSVPKKRV
jgi:hypothetical protein